MKVLGIMLLIGSCLLIGIAVDDTVLLMRLRSGQYASTSFEISQLPFGKRLTGETCYEVHTVGRELITYTKTVRDLEMPTFHLVNNIDISNLMPLIEKKMGEEVVRMVEVMNPVFKTYKADMVVTKEITGSDNEEITVIGKLYGLRFEIKSVYLYQGRKIGSIVIDKLRTIIACWSLAIVGIAFGKDWIRR